MSCSPHCSGSQSSIRSRVYKGTQSWHTQCALTVQIIFFFSSPYFFCFYTISTCHVIRTVSEVWWKPNYLSIITTEQWPKFLSICVMVIALFVGWQPLINTSSSLCVCFFLYLPHPTLSRGLVGTVRVRSWVIHHVYESHVLYQSCTDNCELDQHSPNWRHWLHSIPQHLPF